MRQPASPGSPVSRLPLAFRSLNFVPSAVQPELVWFRVALPPHIDEVPCAYAGVVRTAAKIAAKIVAIRRDDRIIEPSLLPVGKSSGSLLSVEASMSADVASDQSDIRREERFTLTTWISRST